MKKLSLLVALILCVTIGGVYATWSYAENANLSETRNKGVSIAPHVHAGSIGEYEILFNEFDIVIDQTDVGDYTPKLVFSLMSDDGSLNFKFTPAIVASDEVKQNGIASTVTFSSNLTHQDTAIFKFPNELNIGIVGSGETYEWVAEADGSFTCNIPNADLGNFIQLNYTNKLDTFAKYQAFENSLQNGNVVITIANNAGTIA